MQKPTEKPLKDYLYCWHIPDLLLRVWFSRCIRYSYYTKCVWALPLMEKKSAVQHLEHGDAIKIVLCNRIIFWFLHDNGVSIQNWPHRVAMRLTNWTQSHWKHCPTPLCDLFPIWFSLLSLSLAIVNKSLNSSLCLCKMKLLVSITKRYGVSNIVKILIIFVYISNIAFSIIMVCHFP